MDENKNKNPKTGKFIKGNKSASVQKGRQKPKTIVKRKLKEIATWDAVEKVVEKNIIELLSDKNKKIKMEATKAFTEYIKPKKRENTHEIKGNLILRINGWTKPPEIEDPKKK